MVGIIGTFLFFGFFLIILAGIIGAGFILLFIAAVICGVERLLEKIKAKNRKILTR